MLIKLGKVIVLSISLSSAPAESSQERYSDPWLKMESDWLGGVTLFRSSASTGGDFLFRPPLGLCLNCSSNSSKSPWNIVVTVLLVFPTKWLKSFYHIAAQIHQWNMVKQNSHGYKHGIWFSHGYLYLMPQPGMPQTNGLSWRCTAFTCWRRFDFWGYKFKWKIDVIKSLRKWSHEQNYCSYGWKCVETTLEVASDSLWGTSWFMCPEVPLDILPQLLGATCLTDNMLVAGLEMSLEALFISKMFKTSWFGTDCLQVQFNYSGESIC